MAADPVNQRARNILYTAEVSVYRRSGPIGKGKCREMFTRTPAYRRRVLGLGQRRLSRAGPILSPWGDQEKRSRKTPEMVEAGDSLRGRRDGVQYLSQMRAHCLVLKPLAPPRMSLFRGSNGSQKLSESLVDWKPVRYPSFGGREH